MRFPALRPALFLLAALLQACGAASASYLSPDATRTNEAWIVRADAADRRTDPSKLVVMTFNAEFLWDGVAPEEGSADFPWKNSQTEAEEHMQQVATIITQANPDIINLVEVENLESLTTFNTKFLAGRGYKPYFIKGKDTSTGQDVVLLSRVDTETGAIERDDTTASKNGITKGVSKNYYARFTISGQKLALVGLHFLAFPTMAQRVKERECQAEVIRKRALTLRSEGYSVIVLGDFNDYESDPGSRDHKDSQPTSHVLETARAMDPGDATDDLVNAASFVVKPNRYTAFWDQNSNGQVDPPNELSSIDHLLLSKDLAAKVDFVEIPHLHDPTRHPDHFPIVVHFKWSTTAATGGVRMIRLLPNPSGDDGQNEEVTLKNTSTTTSFPLAGWKLRDLANTTWSLNTLGTFAPGESKTIKRLGQAMSLNNTGDTIELIRDDGTVLQTVTYGTVQEGDEITPD